MQRSVFLEEAGLLSGKAGCVADMSFLYTPEYFAQAFHISGGARSQTNKFFDNGEITSSGRALT